MFYKGKKILFKIGKNFRKIFYQMGADIYENFESGLSEL